MRIGKILTTVGSSLLRNLVPGAGIVIDAVNAFLPEEKKLDINTATGDAVNSAINSLPPETRASLLSKELDVEIEEEKGFTTRFAAAMEADKTGNSTRPQIALMMAYTVCFVIVIFSSMWIVAIFRNQVDLMDKLKECWPLMLAVIATPTALLRAYFAMRSKEKEARYQMASNQEVSVGGMISGIITALKK